MALDEANREAVWAGFMRDESLERWPIAVVKAALKEATDAADDWVDANAASFNAALPPAARNNLTARQKAKLLAMVLHQRYGVTA